MHNTVEQSLNQRHGERLPVLHLVMDIYTVSRKKEANSFL